jgi:hypothetical protein
VTVLDLQAMSVPEKPAGIAAMMSVGGIGGESALSLVVGCDIDV